MKPLRSLTILLCLVIATVPVGCDQGPTSGLQVGPQTPRLSTHLDELVLFVAPQQKACQGEAPQLCLLVKEKPEHDWQLFYDPIEGFTYEPGYTYTLRVGLDRIASPPADASSILWRLIEVVEKARDR